MKHQERPLTRAEALITTLVDCGAFLQVTARGAILYSREPLPPDLEEEVRQSLPEIIKTLRGCPCERCEELEAKGQTVIACGCGHSSLPSKGKTILKRAKEKARAGAG